MLSPNKRRWRSIRSDGGAFSLVEVIAAVGIFAVGVVAVLGLFAPIAQSIHANGEAEAAAGMTEALSSHLRARPFATAVGYLKTREEFQSDATRSNYDPSADERVLYASLTGDKIGLRGDSIWGAGD